MSRRVILVGDPTDHGGVVISGSPNAFVQGRSIARKGDNVNCPLLYPNKTPHGINPIIEGDETHTIDGISVALEGHKTQCGCKLIASIGFSVD